MAIQQRETLNFLVPAQGGTQALGLVMPGDNPAGSYALDFRSLNLVVQGTLFIPQACTVDLSQLAAPLTVTFQIPSLGFECVLFAGQTKTFQFPAITDLSVVFVPSAGSPSFPTFWYNYPAIPDDIGLPAASATVQVTSLPAAPLAAAQNWAASSGRITAAGATSIYTPTSRFILRRIDLYLDPVSTQAVAGANTVEILDGAAVMATWPIFIPAAAGSQNVIKIGELDFTTNPYLSAAANNHLQVNLATALTAGGVLYNAFISG